MKLVTTFFIMALAMVLMAAGIKATVKEEEEEKILISLSQNSTSSPGKVSRFLATTNPRAYNCRRNPSICLAARSPGPVCCRNKCVNLKTDHQNCGACGYKCKFTTACCRGQCVYLAFDKRHCGRCNNRCDKGEYCIYGFCNYA